MRIADLSRRGGVPVATVKFYLRERLLPPGIPTGRNQAAYDDEHLMRLRVIRILTSLGGHSLASVRELFTALDDPDLTDRDRSQVVNRILGESAFADRGPIEWARRQVDDLVSLLGWQIAADTPGREALAQILAAFRTVDPACDATALTPVAALAETVAKHDVASIEDGSAVTFAARAVLLDQAFAAIRRMAQEHMLAQQGGPQ